MEIIKIPKKEEIDVLQGKTYTADPLYNKRYWN